MLKRKIWLIGICVVVIAFGVNAFAMMSGNNGYRSHSPGNGYGDSHTNDYDKGLHHRDTYGVPRSNYDSINRNHNDSQGRGYDRGYQRNYQAPSKSNKFREYPRRDRNTNGNRYRENYRYQRYERN